MDKKILIVIGIIIISLIVGVYFVYENQQKKIEILSQYQKQDITFLKFVSSENGMYSLNSEEIEELKSMNVNGIRICPLYSLRQDGNIKEDISESWVIATIEEAHLAGFAVFLDINVGGQPTETGEPEHRYDDPKYVDDLYNIALHWAEIAEKEKVEFYSPLNEPDLMFTSLDLVNQWINKSQELRSVFSGNLVLKFADIGPQEIKYVESYDYLSFDIMWSDPTYQELREHLEHAVEKGNNLKKQYNLKGFFFGELGAERSSVNKSVQAELFKIFLEETWGKVDGYCFLGWSSLEFKFRDNSEAKEIIKEWYSKNS